MEKKSNKRRVSFAPVPLDSITEETSILNDDEQEKSVLLVLGVWGECSREIKEKQQRRKSSLNP